MGTPWDRAAAGYVEQWVPRFVPYHHDIVRELTLNEGDRVLVASAGPGAEVLAVARAVGDRGEVRSTDRSASMVRYCYEQVKKAGFRTAISCEEADIANTAGGPWDSILCCFGLWLHGDRGRILRSWKEALAPLGKIGVATWGPPDPDDPYEILRQALVDVAPEYATPMTRVDPDRAAMTRMFDEAGLELARLTIARHTIAFRSTEEFLLSVAEGCIMQPVLANLDDDTYHKVAVRFYDAVGGPDAPLTFRPAATLAIATHPGAVVELVGRPTLRPPNGNPSVPSPPSRPPPPSSIGNND